MMVLAAVLLVIGLIALAGMVARVNQLGSQTAVEANKAILDEVVPLAKAMDNGIGDLRGPRTVTITSQVTGNVLNRQITVSSSTPLAAADVGRVISRSVPAGTGDCLPSSTVPITITTVTSTTTGTISVTPTTATGCDVVVGGIITGVVTVGTLTTVRSCTSALCTTTVPAFAATDVGKPIIGANFPAGATITAFVSSSQVTISAAATAGSGLSLSTDYFALTTVTTPTIQQGVVALLEQLQSLEARFGFQLDYELHCTGAAATTALAVAHLSDGTVWIEVRSSVPFAIAPIAPAVTACIQDPDCPSAVAPATTRIIACG